MHFQFPECQQIALNSLLSRASSNGIHLMEHLLQWDPDRRPTAQQTLKYSFFQIVARTADTGYISLPDTQIARHHNYFNTRTSALSMRYSSLDNEQWAAETTEYGLNMNRRLSKQNDGNASLLNNDMAMKKTIDNGATQIY